MWQPTRGPWEAGHSAGGTPVVWDADGVPVARVGVHTDTPAAEVEANCRLLAAAPALRLAWFQVPEETRRRVLNALRERGAAWADVSIGTIS